MSSKPWNSWLGLHEGDMALEMAELDMAARGRLSDSEGLKRDVVDRWEERAKDDPEGVRVAWWYAIGRHTTQINEVQ